MNLAILRVEGNDETLQLVKKELKINVDSQWKKGETRRNGAVHELSGFSATISDTENPVNLVKEVGYFLNLCKGKNIVFSNFGLIPEIDIGFSVGDSKQFVASVQFSPSELLMCAEIGITLCITAYPTSDEANAT